MRRVSLIFSLIISANSILAQTAVSNRTESEALAFITQLHKRITLKGENFAVLAIKYSEDPGSAPQGGTYSDINKGDFMKKFEDNLLNLKPGEISKPFKTGYGYHIVELLSARGDKYTCRHILITFK